MAFSVFCILIFIAFSSAHYHNPLNNLRMKDASVSLSESITIKASPSEIWDNDGWVTVSFSGVDDPTRDDWIGVYSPSSADSTSTAPIKYQFAAKSKNYVNNGAGSVHFKIINMWSDYQFRFFRNGTYYPILVATSNVVTFQNPNVPLQAHLALGEDISEMRLSWATAQNETNYVKWWSDNTATSYATATVSTYTANDLCGSPANDFGWRDIGYLQTAIMGELTPNTLYYYSFGNGNTWTEAKSFQSAPISAADTAVSLIAFGDMGKGEPDGSYEHWDLERASLNTTKNIMSNLESTDLILHIGDISYAVGYSSQWNEFMWQIEPIATRVAYMTCIGNHERDYPNSDAYYNGTDSGGECGVPYSARFIMPNSATQQPWYSFNYGNIHFVMMSTEQNFKQGSEQYAWLVNDLSSVKRDVTPWIIFSGHRPMYVDSNFTKPPDGDQPVAQLLRQELEGLFYKYRVNLALWGHNHSYQRTCPVYQEQCGSSSDFTTHVVIGMAGFDLSRTQQTPTPSYIVKETFKDYGFCKIQTTASELAMQFYTNQNPNTPFDQFTLS